MGEEHTGAEKPLSYDMLVNMILLSVGKSHGEHITKKLKVILNAGHYGTGTMILKEIIDANARIEDGLEEVMEDLCTNKYFTVEKIVLLRDERGKEENATVYMPTKKLKKVSFTLFIVQKYEYKYIYRQSPRNLNG